MRRRRTFRLTSALLALSALTLLSLALVRAEAPSSVLPQRAQVRDELRGENLLKDVVVLSLPQMEGRATGTPGIRRAAEHIAGEFRRAGLAPSRTSSVPEAFSACGTPRFVALPPRGQETVNKGQLDREGQQWILINGHRCRDDRLLFDTLGF